MKGDTMRRQKRDVLELLALVVIIVAALALAACGQYPGPTQPSEINITNNNTNNNGQPQGGPGTSLPPGTCPKPNEVTNGLLGQGGVKNTTLVVGQVVALDTTANKGLDEQCSSFRKVFWRIEQSSLVCELDNPEAFTPTLRARAVGACTVRASIDSVNADIPISVQVTARPALTFWDLIGIGS